MRSGDATNTNFIVFGLTRSGIEPTIYRSRGEHANSYTQFYFSLPMLSTLFQCQSKQREHCKTRLICFVWPYYIQLRCFKIFFKTCVILFLYKKKLHVFDIATTCFTDSDYPIGIFKEGNTCTVYFGIVL